MLDVLKQESTSGLGRTHRVAIVTGGAGGEVGLGLTTTETLCRQGIAVAVWDSNADALEAAAQELSSLGLRARFHQVDVTDPDQVDAAYEEVHSQLGAADILINNAVMYRAGTVGSVASRNGQIPFWTYDPIQVRRVFEVNVVGPLITCARVVPSMIERAHGVIVNVVTSAHTQRSGAHIPYGPSKAALEALTIAMADQLRGTGVRVNSVLPGGSANRRGEYRADRVSHDAMVEPILWLVSDESEAVTGEVIVGTSFRLKGE